MKTPFFLILVLFSLVSCQRDQFDDPEQNLKREVRLVYSTAFGIFENLDKPENETNAYYTNALPKYLTEFCQDSGQNISDIKEVSLYSAKMYEISQNNPDIISNLDLNDEVKVYLTKNGHPDLLIAEAAAPFDDVSTNFSIKDIDDHTYLLEEPLRYKIEVKHNTRLEYYNGIGFSFNFAITFD